MDINTEKGQYHSPKMKQTKNNKSIKKALYFWSLFTEDLGQRQVSAEKNSLDIMQNISFCAPQN